MRCVCVIGDSHAAALKRAWPSVEADFPDVRLDFFAAAAHYITSLTVRDDALVPTTEALRKRITRTSGGLETIAGSYDCYLLCGLDLRLGKVAEMKKLRGMDARPSSTDPGEDIPSEELGLGVRATIAMRTLQMLRQITDAPVGIIPTPLPASDHPSRPTPHQGARRLQDVFLTACAKVALEVQAQFIPQPSETLSDTGLSTRAEYARSPERLFFQQDVDDYSHMNAEYGAIVLRNALNIVLDSGRPGTSRKSPYENLPPTAFWRTGVVGHGPDAIPGLYRRKFAVDRTTPIATAGSCFSQHLSRYLRARGFSVIDAEPAPARLRAEDQTRFGYGIFSARYANIYTARQLKQIVLEAFGEFAPSDWIWEKDGRYYDAIRPSVEPEGLSTPELVRTHRRRHLKRIREVIETARLFVFTLGLTEAWTHAQSGTVYPTAPGTIAGRYDPQVHALRNFTFQDIYCDLNDFFAFARTRNPMLKFLLTVSPVPITATATGEHVLAASVYTKSVLRAVAGQLFHENDDVDYYPAYEIVAGPQTKGVFYDDNLRTIRPEGVAAAMCGFLAENDDAGQPLPSLAPLPQTPPAEGTPEDVVCEDILLEAFAQ